MTRWKLRCVECGREWILPVSFRLDKMGKLYHFCPYCKKNTFHVVIERVEEAVEGTSGAPGGSGRESPQ